MKDQTLFLPPSKNDKPSTFDVYNWRHERAVKKSAEARKAHKPRKTITLADIIAAKKASE